MTLDGKEIQSMQVKWIRQQMDLVSQESALNDTIRANIAHGKGEDATEGEVIDAAELENANNFINSLQEERSPGRQIGEGYEAGGLYHFGFRPRVSFVVAVTSL
ncbi:multidrug resistance protein 1-like [Vigna unguiculata]|uniref:multidrug resistance protein 1-like n=1 Tax=Vigna unguiculata TaxID=3917 RepID=UPI001015F8AC|nr:multidrug resistance protein 1-like [Vigna unguiculata]